MCARVPKGGARVLKWGRRRAQHVCVLCDVVWRDVAQDVHVRHRRQQLARRAVQRSVRRCARPRRPRHTLISTRLFASRIAWLASWIDPAVGNHIQRSDHWDCLQRLLSRHALATYRRRGGRAGSYDAVIEGSDTLGHIGTFHF